MNLTNSPVGVPLRVIQLTLPDDHDPIGRRLMELGFIVGATVELRHRAPLFKDPIAVMVRGMVVALRGYEAMRIQVEVARPPLHTSEKAS